MSKQNFQNNRQKKKVKINRYFAHTFVIALFGAGVWMPAARAGELRDNLQSGQHTLNDLLTIYQNFVFPASSNVAGSWVVSGGASTTDVLRVFSNQPGFWSDTPFLYPLSLCGSPNNIIAYASNPVAAEQGSGGVGNTNVYPFAYLGGSPVPFTEIFNSQEEDINDALEQGDQSSLPFSLAVSTPITNCGSTFSNPAVSSILFPPGFNPSASQILAESYPTVIGSHGRIGVEEDPSLASYQGVFGFGGSDATPSVIHYNLLGRSLVGGDRLVSFSVNSPTGATLGTDYIIVGFIPSASTIETVIFDDLSDPLLLPIRDGSSRSDLYIVPRATNETYPEHEISVTFQPPSGFDSFADQTVITRILGVSVPTLTITQPSDQLNRGGESSFTISRDDFNNELVLPYTIGGTATNGADYSFLDGNILIPSGVPSVTIPINAMFPSVAQSSEVLSLSFFEDIAYNFAGGDPVVLNYNLPSYTPSQVDLIVPNDTVIEPGVTGVTEFLTLTRTGDAIDPLMVNYSTGGTATPGPDYVPLSGTVTFDAGESTASIPLAVSPETGTTAEPEETIVLTLQPGDGYSLPNPNPSTTLTIPAYSPSTVSIAPSTGTTTLTPGSTSEGFTISRTGDTSAPLPVGYTVGGTATNGADYNQLSGIAIIPAGATETFVQVAARAESGTTAEPEETITLAIAPGEGYAGDNTGISFTIPAYTPPVTPEVTLSPVSGDTILTPGGSSDGLEVTRTGDTTGALTVAYTVSGTATNGSDYTFLPGQVTIPAGQSSVILPIAVPDALTRSNDGETVTVALAAAPNGDYDSGTNTSSTFTIDIPDGVTLSTATTTSPPGFQISRPTNSDLSDPLTIPYNIGGTATAGDDFESLPGFVTIPPGQTVGTVPLNILDTATAGDTVEIAFQPPEGYEVAQPGTVAIASEDIPDMYVAQTVNIAPATGTSNILTPGATDEAFVISRSGGSMGNASPLTVTYTVSGTATPGSDYTTLSQTAIIPAGTDEVTIPLVAYQNSGSTVESDESIIIVLQAGSGYTLETSTETFTIPAYTPNQVSIATIGGASMLTPGTPGGGFMLSRANGDMGEALNVAYIVSGSATSVDDYTPIAESATIPAGEVSVEIPVFAYANTSDTAEPDETVTVTLDDGSGYSVVGSSNSATLTIPGYTPSTVNIAPAVGTGNTLTPGATDEAFTITRTGDTSGPLFVNYSTGGTATPGQDYNQLSGVASIPAGETSTTVQVLALPESGDTAEPEETITLAIAPGEGYAGDNTGISFTIPAYTPPADTPQITISAENGDTFLTPGSSTEAVTVTRTGDTSAPITVPLDIGGSATNGQDYSLPTSVTIPSGASMASVPIMVPMSVGPESDGETVTVSLPPSADGSYTGGTNTSTTFTISSPTEDIPLSTTVSGSGTNPPAFQISRPSDSDLGDPLAIAYTPTGTATSGEDYVAPSGTVTIPAGQTVGTVPLDLLNTATPGETIGLSFSAPAGHTLSGSAPEYTIAAEDLPTTTVQSDYILVPTLSGEPIQGDSEDVFVNGQGGLEIPSGEIPTITVNRDASDPGTTPVTIPYSVSGTATPGQDYETLSGILTIPAGSTSGQIPIELFDTAQPGETIQMTFGDPGEGFGISTPTVEYVVNDLDVPQTLSAVSEPELSTNAFSQSDASGDGTNDLLFTVTRPEGDPGTSPITLTYSVGGTAIPGEDYVAPSGTVTIPAGQTTGEVLIDVLPTAVPGRTIDVLFDDPDEYDIANNGEILTEIPGQDLDTPIEINVISDSPGIRAFVSDPSILGGNEVAIPYTVGGTAIPGVDYVLDGDGTLRIDPETGEASLPIQILPGATPGRTVEFEFESPDGYELSALLASYSIGAADIPEDTSVNSSNNSGSSSGGDNDGSSGSGNSSGGNNNGSGNSSSNLEPASLDDATNSDGSSGGDGGGSGLGVLGALGTAGAIAAPIVLSQSAGGATCPAQPLPDTLMQEVRQFAQRSETNIQGIDWSQVRFDRLPNQDYLLSDFPNLGNRLITDIAAVSANQSLEEILGSTSTSLSTIVDILPGDTTVGSSGLQAFLAGNPTFAQAVQVPLSELGELDLGDLLESNPQLANIDLSQMPSNQLLGLNSLIIQEIPDWSDRSVASIPGMLSRPFNQLFPCLEEEVGRNDGNFRNPIDQIE